MNSTTQNLVTETEQYNISEEEFSANQTDSQGSKQVVFISTGSGVYLGSEARKILEKKENRMW